METEAKLIIHGERNTRFYYAITTSTRAKNRILAFKNSMGEWMYNQQHTLELLVQHFQNLFHTFREKVFS